MTSSLSKCKICMHNITGRNQYIDRMKSVKETRLPNDFVEAIGNGYPRASQVALHKRRGPNDRIKNKAVWNVTHADHSICRFTVAAWLPGQIMPCSFFKICAHELASTCEGGAGVRLLYISNVVYGISLREFSDNSTNNNNNQEQI